jgi:hypothetical protein
MLRSAARTAPGRAGTPASRAAVLRAGWPRPPPAGQVTLGQRVVVVGHRLDERRPVVLQLVLELRRHRFPRDVATLLAAEGQQLA